MGIAIDRKSIEATHAVIKPYVRATPVVEVSGADFGLSPFPLTFKLEHLQHSGSFEALRLAQDALWASARIVAEPGGAAPLAALLSGGYTPAPGERIGVLISGANTTAVEFEAPKHQAS